ncbi:MAG: hypothetical protein WC666_00840 [Candidatus Paceibacterota bacterium]|jgi:hypothetical protein
MNSMLNTHNHIPYTALAEQGPQFVSRIFTDPAGRQFRLTFLVAVVDGEVKGRLVSAEPVSYIAAGANDQVPISNDQFCLPIFCDENKPDTKYIPAFAPVVSPYFSLEFLINSQPTRAPSQR